MKKFICISFCVLLCVPFLVLSVFAEDVSVFFDCVAEAQSASFILDGVTISLSSPDLDFSRSLSTSEVHSIRGTVRMSDGNKQLVALYNGSNLSTDSSSPTVIEFGDSITISYGWAQFSGTYYFTINDPPVDPLAPVNTGVGVVINSFGDVIDYVVNTPSVAVFVALSVSCALIPLGIVLVKKVIKGY